jgi:hypothetical protein
VCPGFLNDVGSKVIATQQSAGGVQKHEVGGPVLEVEWGQSLQGQPAAATDQYASSLALLEAQLQTAITSDAVRPRRAVLFESTARLRRRRFRP